MKRNSKSKKKKPSFGTGWVTTNDEEREGSCQMKTQVEYGKFKLELIGTGIKYVIVLPVHIALDKVHEIMQELFDWDEEHLWDFEDEFGRRYVDEVVWGADDDFIKDCISPSKAFLGDVLPLRGDKLIYTYDFGDNHRHLITRMADPKVGGCYCVKSEYIQPPELEYFGYANMLDDDCEAWQQPSVEEVNAMLKSRLTVPESWRED